jgi:hypothetical protein
MQYCSPRADLAGLLGDGTVSFNARIGDFVEFRRWLELDMLTMGPVGCFLQLR